MWYFWPPNFWPLNIGPGLGQKLDPPLHGGVAAAMHDTTRLNAGWLASKC